MLFLYAYQEQVALIRLLKNAEFFHNLFIRDSLYLHKICYKHTLTINIFLKDEYYLTKA